MVAGRLECLIKVPGSPRPLSEPSPDTPVSFMVSLGTPQIRLPAIRSTGQPKKGHCAQLPAEQKKYHNSYKQNIMIKRELTITETHLVI
jgi:hypothetical protein